MPLTGIEATKAQAAEQLKHFIADWAPHDEADRLGFIAQLHRLLATQGEILLHPFAEAAMRNPMPMTIMETKHGK